ncbi:MAG: ABC transporter ATP-binding protein [Acidimicrobiales bacterium]
MTNAIEIQGLVKSYGDVHAVRGIDLAIAEGEIFGFLGANGAGKTTTIEILEGFRQRTAGEVRVLGQDPATAPLSWREELGIVLQESEVEGELTALEALTLQAAYYARPRNSEEVLELVGLTESGGQRTNKLSGGQKRRLDLALALMGNPKLIFLDEPTTGFDPSARREAWEMIANLRSLGCTVLLTTHYMDEAQYLADRIAVINAGKIVAEGTASELADQVAVTPRITWKADDSVQVPEGFGAFREIESMIIETNDIVEVVHALTGWAKEQAVDLVDLDIVRPTLEDTFLQLTGGS